MTRLTRRPVTVMRHEFVHATCVVAGVCLWSLTFGVLSDVSLRADGAPAQDVVEESDSAIQRELVTGRVVLLGEALKRRDLRVAEEMADQAVLETPEGDLIPLLADWRGRAFFQDERLRDRKVELVAYRREHLPYLQVLMVFTFDEDGERQYTDYWCDICSIPMYEIKACECCQGDIRLRFQPQDLPDYLHEDDATAESADAINE